MKEYIKKVCVAFCLFLLATVFAVPVTAHAKTQEEALQWVRSKVGQAIDVDGWYGAQCVDFIMAYYEFLGVPRAFGNGADYAWNALPAGWTRIAGAVPQPGDILVYTGGDYGHVAIFESTWSTYHQNYNWVQSVQNVTYAAYNDPAWFGGYWGVIRPKFDNPAPLNITYHNMRIEFVDSRNAKIRSDISNPSGASVTEVGAYIWDSTGRQIVDHIENTGGWRFTESWQSLDVVGEALPSGLRPGSTYVCQFWAKAEGQTFYSGKISFTTENCNHSWDGGSVTKAATCTQDGVKTYNCTLCGETKTESIHALGHSFSSFYTTDIGATCTQAGSKSRHCTRCSAKTGVTKIPALGHSWDGGMVTKAATCTQDGVKTYTCTRCRGAKTVGIPALGHSYASYYTTDRTASCAQAGSKSRHCARCSARTGITEIPALGHIWDGGVVTKAATATTTGVRMYTCIRCRGTRVSIIPATGGSTGGTAGTVKVSLLKISGSSSRIAAGKKLQLKAAVSPSNATNKAVAWSSSNKKYAAVTEKGMVTAKKAGAGKTVTITAKAKDGSGKQAVYKIKIMKGAVKKITLQGSKSVKAGKTLKLKAKVTASGGANKTLTFSSSNTKYATVTKKGMVTAKKAGKGKTVKITARATDGSGKKATVKIKIL